RRAPSTNGWRLLSTTSPTSRPNSGYRRRRPANWSERRSWTVGSAGNGPEPTWLRATGRHRGDNVAERETRASNEAPPEYVVRRGADLGADVDDLVVVYAAATSPNGQDVRARREVMLRHTRAPDAVGVLA